MKLTLVRHGETDYNAKRLVQGYKDNPLNETGRNQAKTMGKLLKLRGYHFDVLGSSELLRAKETAEIIGSFLNLELQFTDNDFIERNFGPFEGQSIDEVFPAIVLNDFKHEGYEDNTALLKRIKRAIMKLYKQYKDKEVLLVAHSHVVKSALILAKPNTDFANHHVLNSSAFFFEVSADKIEFVKQIDA